MHSLMTKTGGKSRPSGWYRKEALRIDVGREVGRDRGGEETGGERTVSKGSLRGRKWLHLVPPERRERIKKKKELVRTKLRRRESGQNGQAQRRGRVFTCWGSAVSRKARLPQHVSVCADGPQRTMV